MLTDFRVAPTLAWNEAFAGWLAEDGRKKGGKGKLAHKSILAYLQDSDHFGRWFEQSQGCGFAFELMSRGVVRSYFDWQIQQGAKPNSYNRRLASLRVMARFGLELGLLAEDPTDRIERMSEEALPPRAKTAEELKAFGAVMAEGAQLARHTEKWSFLGLRDQVIWGLAMEAGLRESEIAALPIKAVDFKRKYISVCGKGSFTGHVKVSRRLLLLLEQWLMARPKNGDALVCDWSGNGLDRTTIWRRIHAVGVAAGVDVSTHELRHNFGLAVMRESLKAGASPESALDVVRRQMRHQDVRTSLRYLRATDNDLERVMEAI